MYSVDALYYVVVAGKAREQHSVAFVSARMRAKHTHAHAHTHTHTLDKCIDKVNTRKLILKQLTKASSSSNSLSGRKLR